MSLSFDNAVINATVLQRMSEFWQKIFLTIGILIAVFGMRLLFPLVIVWVTAGLDPVEAFDLAMNPPADERTPDSSPTRDLLTDAHPQIAAFGGMFLLMLFLNFIFEEREITWLTWLEKPLAKIGKLDQLSVVIAGGSLVLIAEFLADDDQHRDRHGRRRARHDHLHRGQRPGSLFHTEELAAEHEEAASRAARPNSAKATGKAGVLPVPLPRGPRRVVLLRRRHRRLRHHRRPDHHRPGPRLHRRDVRPFDHGVPGPQGHARPSTCTSSTARTGRSALWR